jgi:hypothetical protein
MNMPTAPPQHHNQTATRGILLLLGGVGHDGKEACSGERGMACVKRGVVVNGSRCAVRRRTEDDDEEEDDEEDEDEDEEGGEANYMSR